MISNHKLPMVLALLLLSLAGCQRDLVVIHDDAPLRLATPTDADVFYDLGAPAAPGHPHVENWVRAPNRVRLPAGKYVITRREQPATLPAR